MTWQRVVADSVADGQKRREREKKRKRKEENDKRAASTEVDVQSPGRQDFLLRSRIAAEGAHLQSWGRIPKVGLGLVLYADLRKCRALRS